MSYNLTGATVSSTYGRIVQVVLGAPNLYYDGFGNLLNLGPGTASIGPQGPTGSQGTSMVFQGEWVDNMRYFYYDFVTYNGNAYLCTMDLTGSTPWTSPDLDTTHWEQMLIGLSGTSGVSGATGSDGTSGTSGESGTSGTSGESGTSGTSGESGTSGTSGESGTSGTSGESGTSGTSGESGTSGTSGESGTSGTSGESGTSGTSGESGTSGTSGESGTSGTSGESGTSGTSGESGTSGTSGESGTSGTSGESGTSGTSGESGTSGTSGESGTSGTSGESGTSGTSGESGTSGTSGTNGESGTSGTNGESGTSGTSGESGTSGTSGESGTSGTSGAQGPQGISAGQIYYFNMSMTASVNGYRSLSTTPLPNGGTYSIETLTGNELGHLVETFMTEPLGFSIIPGGTQRFHLHFLKGAVGHDIEAYVSIRLTNSVGVPIGPTLSTNKQYIGWNDSTTNVEVLIDLTLPTTGIDPTNRMLVNIYLDNKDSNSRTIQWHTEGTDDYSYVITSVGVNGTSGVDGTSGTSGTSGLLSLTGTTDNGIITLNGTSPNGTVESKLTFDGSTLNVSGDTRLGGQVIGSASTNTIMSDTLIQAGLLFLSNNC